MIAHNHHNLGQILVRSPLFAVARPFSCELIAIPFSSGLTANLPPQNGYFAKKNRGVKINLLITTTSDKMELA